MRLVLYFVPEPWRTRYGDEIRDALAMSETRLRDSLDVIAWGARLRIERRPYRFAAAVALTAAFILVWLALGVGVVGEDGDPFNRMYAGVLGVGILGAVIARFQPRGMARALFATALAQTSVTVIALVIGKHQSPVSSIPEIVILNGFFIVLFAGSASLFRYAARERPPMRAGAEGLNG